MPRTVIVVGGFGTLGRAVAAAFVAAGDMVARVDVAAQVHPETAGAALDIAGVDVAEPSVAADVLERVTTTIGAPSVLVNVVGGYIWNRTADGARAEWEAMFRLNVLTAAEMSRAALPAIIAAGAGRIINVGAMAGEHASAGMGAYAAAKSAVHRLTEALAAELRGTGATANAVMPSIIDTPVNREAMPDADWGGWVKPAALADLIVCLASPAARAVTGALIPVSAGSAD